jgi:hypothetical protein
MPPSRSRQPGGGRKKVTDKDPTVVADLKALVESSTRGDPTTPLWTTKSTRTLSAELAERSHTGSSKRVGDMLHYLDYSLQGNAKVIEGTQHPDRDAQFRHIADKVRRFHHTGDPVASVDTKKKDLVGAHANSGATWRPKGDPERVLVHDFRDPKVPKAIPYGVYDLKRNHEWVSVGSGHDTATFALETLRRWWKEVGRPAYPRARRLLVCADAGGSNGYRLRLWKLELARVAEEIRVPHHGVPLPPGDVEVEPHIIASPFAGYGFRHPRNRASSGSWVPCSRWRLRARARPSPPSLRAWGVRPARRRPPRRSFPARSAGR